VLIEEWADAELFDEAVKEAAGAGLGRKEAGRQVSNVVLQQLARVANERSVRISDLGVSAGQIAAIAGLRSADAISASNAGRWPRSWPRSARRA